MIDGTTGGPVVADVPAGVHAAGVPRGDVRRRTTWRLPSDTVLAVGLVLVTALAFAGSLANDFVEWDDYALFVDNPQYRGLGWRPIAWMFTTTTMGHYVPIMWLTIGLDYVLWGMWPGGYHLTNVLIHAANVAVFFFIARRLFAASTQFTPAVRSIAAAAAALFFGLHPLRVESVAWVTERRDVLSGLFFLVTILLYVRAVASPATSRDRRYYLLHAAACVAFLLAILSKAMVMTLPAVLVLLDVYPLRRLGGPRTWLSPAARVVWREKVPYAALGGLAAMLGYYAQAINGFFTSADTIALTARPSLALYSVWFYVSKTALPLRLSPLYELPAQIDPLAWRFLGPAAAVIAITVALVVMRRRWPGGLTAWASYVVMLSPVAGLTHSGFQLAHDRYSYLPCLGLALLVGGVIGMIRRAADGGLLRAPLVRATALAIAIWYVGLALLTWQQVEIWRNTDMLWRNAAESEPECSLCRYNLGARAFNAGLHAVAREEFERLLRDRPDRFQVHAPLGAAQVSLGDVRQAIPHYFRVLAKNPNDSQTHNNLGAAFHLIGRHRDSLREFEWAMRLEPENAAVRANVGIAHSELGDREQALRYLRRAIEMKPEMAHPRFALGTVLVATGRFDEARAEYERLRRLDASLASVLGPGLLETW